LGAGGAAQRFNQIPSPSQQRWSLFEPVIGFLGRKDQGFGKLDKEIDQTQSGRKNFEA